MVVLNARGRGRERKDWRKGGKRRKGGKVRVSDRLSGLVALLPLSRSPLTHPPQYPHLTW